MDIFQILKENMIRFKTKNLNEDSFQQYKGVYKTWPEWQNEGFSWVDTKYAIKATTDKHDQPLKLHPIYMMDVPKNNTKLGDTDRNEAFQYFYKNLKQKSPDYINHAHKGMVIKESGSDYILACLVSENELDVAVVTRSYNQTWDRLTDKAWNTDSSSADDSIPLDKSILFTDIYVSAPAKPGSEYELSSQLHSLARAAGINVNKKVFKQAGGRVINRTNVADMNHPGVESQLQYAVVFINDPAYDEIRTTTYPNLDTHIYGKGVKKLDKSIIEM